MNRFLSLLISPLICVGLLSGLMAEKRTHLKPEDAEPFHAQAKAAISAIPYSIEGWYGHDDEVTPAAVKLLRPNIIFSRTYVNPTQPNGRAGFLIVQCKDSRDMLGHYPPICYPAHGMTKTNEKERNWNVAGMDIPGMEYTFVQSTHERELHMTVYNFMVVPGRGIVRDMKGVSAAAKDYQLRYLGAAQVQVTFSADHTEAERDGIFATLLGPNVSVIRTLSSGVSK